MLLGLVALAMVPLSALWVAALVDVPAAGLVLFLAVVAGPASGWLDPDALMGDLLLPLLSITVGLLVFRAALRLRFAELDVIGRAGLRLGAAGMAVTWPIASATAFLLLRLDASLALLLGAAVAMAAPSPRFPGAGTDVEAVLASEGCLLDVAGATVILCVLEGILFGGAAYRQDIVAVLITYCGWAAWLVLPAPRSW